MATEVRTLHAIDGVFVLTCRQPSVMAILVGEKGRWRVHELIDLIDGIPVFAPVEDAEGRTLFTKRRDAIQAFRDMCEQTPDID